ncbi:hypothetical protein V8687_09650 [Shewanella baltica]|jgi:hypothetical protein|uniref:hypothetical protein n=1 Tax=Shewanella baltica TaxID=62322 RepID=UPI000E025990|nr:hypothetical protein [Shewanella baltica]RBP73448.1 hypothetical protein DET47_1296 [Shewanella putrefaciens]
MKLMKAMAWAKREFADGSVPDNKTVRRWVERNVIAGRVIDGNTYVFETEKAGVDSHVSQAVQALLRE